MPQGGGIGNCSSLLLDMQQCYVLLLSFSLTFGNLKSVRDYYYLGFWAFPFSGVGVGEKILLPIARTLLQTQMSLRRVFCWICLHVLQRKLGGNREDWAKDGNMHFAKFQPLWKSNFWTMEQAEILIFYKLVYFQQVELLVLGKKNVFGF